jgi:hypothetical protein
LLASIAASLRGDDSYFPLARKQQKIPDENGHRIRALIESFGTARFAADLMPAHGFPDRFRFIRVHYHFRIVPC